jgi:L-Ala-D/L-Glu epimerase
MQLRVDIENWPYKVPFRVSRGAEASLPVVMATLLDEAGVRGRGEAAGVDYDGETIDSMVKQLAQAKEALQSGIAPSAVVGAMLAGGARNALDCALWDLSAKRADVSAFSLAGFEKPKRIVSAITFGIDTDEATSAAAHRYHDWPLIKIKVNAERHLDVIRLVHEICPYAALIVDPNQSWNCELLNRLAPSLQELGVQLIEQPVARGQDESLLGYTGAVRLAADESLAQRQDLDLIRRYYQVVNIKLDKAGGLTEALSIAHAARAQGLALMVGCMAGTSLAMAPGMIVGQMAEFVDLDGPLLHAGDREFGIEYERGLMQLPSAALWG